MLKLYGSHYFQPSPVKKWAQANFLRFGKMQEACLGIFCNLKVPCAWSQANANCTETAMQYGGPWGPYRGFQVSKNLWYFVWEQNRESISINCNVIVLAVHVQNEIDYTFSLRLPYISLSTSNIHHRHLDLRSITRYWCTKL